jgi:hypothetical protein
MERNLCPANSPKNKKLPDSNEILSLKDNLDSPINERLLIVLAKKK